MRKAVIITAAVVSLVSAASARIDDGGDRVFAPRIDPGRPILEETPEVEETHVASTAARDAWTRLPPPHLEGREKLELWATHYGVPRVRAIAGEGAALHSSDDRALGPVLSPQDFCRAAMEGTAEVTLLDGQRRLFRFDGLGEERQVDCEAYYPGFPALGRARFAALASSRAPSVEGAHGVHLVPYRTIAVDPRFLARGSVIFVPSARGTLITLPSGERRIHDGYFFAADTGGALSANHIDVFRGFDAETPFDFVKSTPQGTFEAYVVDDPWIEEMLADAHWTPRVGKS